ncbi:MAG: hypothetical protein IJF55_00010 [Clostridia bacterium]|nr:hypothetical protein [Clostridia bacterium]
MKKIFTILIAAFILVSATALASCNGDKPVTTTAANVTTTSPAATTTHGIGTLTIEDIEIKEGSSKKINAVFSSASYESEITYTFDGEDIRIEDGKVTALVGDKTVTVTATTAYHTTTFTVKTFIDRGTLSIADVYAWIDYPSPSVNPIFSDKNFIETLAYEYDSANLSIDAQSGVVTPLKEGTHFVKAYSDHFSVTFSVVIGKVDKNSDKFSAKDFADAAADRKAQWELRGADGRTVVFIGDDMFDPKYFTNFSTTVFKDSDALCLGIENTTTYDWEEWVDGGWLSECAPKSLAIHIGGENLVAHSESADEIAFSLIRLASLIREKMPSTEVFLLGITPRNLETEKSAALISANNTVKKWCADQSGITFVDSSTKLDKTMLKDDEHLKIAYYTVFKELLSGAGFYINDIDKTLIRDMEELSFSTNQEIGSGTGRKIVMYRDDYLFRNYVLEGKLDITATNGNPHIQFGILDNGNDRILLWDNEKNGNFKLCIPYTTTGIPAEDIYTLKEGETLTLSFKIVCTDNDLYFYLNGELKLVYTNLADNGNPLTLGSTATSCRFYDMKASTLEYDKEEYNAVINEMSDVIDTYEQYTEYKKIRV